ncbi:hypothetical protein BH24ACT22_BH24ACT22_09490 [soil metagenome]
MAYSVMVWLVNPGEYPQQELEETRAADPESASGASTGANIGHALPRMVYGVYENRDEAEQALFKVSSSLQGNEPLRISARSDRVWLIPAQRVHYVVCEEVERPKD